jgi:hypothetical protein
MIRPRWILLGGALTASAVLTFFLRDVMYQTVVLPLSYLFWVAWVYYSAIPQLFLWIAFLIILLITVISGFVPDGGGNGRTEQKRRSGPGRVETLAIWVRKGRQGNYFKWQIANRLGRLAVELAEMSGRYARTQFGEENGAVQRYLDAGLNSSFVDYPTPPNRFRRPAPTPLDLNPKEAVDYLESQMEMSRGRRP